MNLDKYRKEFNKQISNKDIDEAYKNSKKDTINTRRNIDEILK